jgi:ATP-dependent helicase/nuclease subunit A
VQLARQLCLERRLLVSLDLPDRKPVIELTPEQLRAVERRDGSLLVRAGAGTGKTAVLVERFVRAVVDDGAPVEAVLAITFTEKAAAEMRSRVRRRFIELGLGEQARAAESAWISTIHGFCSRVLRAHALSAGIDPDFRVLDELEAERLAIEAFDGALEDFMDEDLAERVEVVASYTPDRLRDMVRTAHSHLRSRGQRRPCLEEAHPPRPAGERERLESAVRGALAELGAAASSAGVDAALGRLEACAALLDGLPAGEVAAPEDVEGLDVKGRSNALSGAACREYREALAAYSSLCVAVREQRNHAMLRALLELYGERYERLKRSRSGLDFEDLELITRDLLAGDDGVREQYASRFAHVLVDEFQDTNPLQNELLGLLARDNLFRVGDDNQSIYRFRNADVGVFRRHWEEAAAAGRGESIAVNFRTRGEVLDAIDLAFERLWGEHYEPLREAPGARAEPPKVSPSVELIVVDRPRARWDERFDPAGDPFGTAMHGAPPWRAVEARLLARRVDELTRHGPWRFGDVVLLFRATTAMGLFERAFEERGIPVHVVGGRGYWSQQQVADLRHWLSALANPLDELAIYSVLASPLVGLSLDAVALIGLHANRLHRDPLWLLEEAFTASASTNGSSASLREQLPEADRRRVTSFLERLRLERRVAQQVSLETVIDRAVTLTGYDRHVLSLPGGARRMANVRKLMRLAREYEADEGRDLRGFIDSVAERDLIQTREGEAPLEAEALDAVRLMTVHRAKGLEFPVVCLADLGKEGRDDEGTLRISEDGSVGLRLARLGGGAVESERLERIKAEQRAAAEDEERRIFYVACTRAQQHLILSGATDLEKRREPGELCEPMRWVWRGFCPGLPGEGATGEHVDLREGREVRVRWTAATPFNLDELLPEADRALARPAAAAPGAGDGFEQPEVALGAAPAPRALPVSRLSYSGLEDYRRCGYRFYLERALRLGPVEKPHADEPAIEPGLPGLLRGTLLHAMLEGLDFRRPRVPSEAEVAKLMERHGERPRPEDVADLRGMVEGVVASALRERIARARRVRTELPFAFTLEPRGARGRSLLVNGVVDVLASEDRGALVVDWKSDPLEGREPDELLAEAYSTQRLIYALAGLRSGAERVEVAHCFMERPDEPAFAAFTAADAERLESELLELASGVVEARFEPAAEPHYGLCADCPGRAALCSWGPERTLRAPPVSA